MVRMSNAETTVELQQLVKFEPYRVAYMRFLLMQYVCVYGTLILCAYAVRQQTNS